MGDKKVLDSKTAKVLVVDDMILGRISSRNHLKELGFVDIQLASTGTEAWRHIEDANGKGCPFQLILCDWVMPEMSGIELIRKIKSQNWKIAPSVILVTAESDLELVKQALEEGALGYVRKPLSLDSLRAALEKLTA
ncbi:MAG: response regulator [Bdellovibrionia bacterium]